MRILPSMVRRSTPLLILLAAIFLSVSELSVYPLIANGSGSVKVTVSPTSNSVPRGGTVVFYVTIKSSSTTDHIGWGAAVTSPTPTSNGPVLHQSTYHVIGSGTTTFTASATNTTLLTTWTITVTARDVTHCCASDSTTVTLTVTDFTVLASPTTVKVSSGQSATSTITASGQNGFSGTIYYSVNEPSYTCNLQPSSATLGTTVTSASSTLSCNFPTGKFAVTITGTPFSGVPSHTATVTITVS